MSHIVSHLPCFFFAGHGPCPHFPASAWELLTSPRPSCSAVRASHLFSDCQIVVTGVSCAIFPLKCDSRPRATPVGLEKRLSFPAACDQADWVSAEACHRRCVTAVRWPGWTPLMGCVHTKHCSPLCSPLFCLVLFPSLITIFLC